MADNTSGQPIGTARVDFVGDTSKLKAAADEAQKLVQETGDKTQAESIRDTAAATREAADATEATARASESVEKSAGGITALFEPIKNLNKQLQSTVGAVTQFVGRLSLIGAAAAGAITGIVAFGRWLVTIGEEAEKAARKIADPLEVALARIAKSNPGVNLEGLKQDLEDLKKIRDQIASEMSRISASDNNKLLQDAIQKEYIDPLKKQEADILARIRSGLQQAGSKQQQADDEAATNKRKKELAAQEEADYAAIRGTQKVLDEQKRAMKERADAEELESLDGVERILEERKRAEKEISELRIQNFDSEYQAELDRFEKANREKFDKRISAALEAQYKESAEEQRRTDEQERRQKEADARVVRAYEDAMRQAQDRINAQAVAQNPINGLVLNSLNEIRDILSGIGSQRDRRAL